MDKKYLFISSCLIFFLFLQAVVSAGQHFSVLRRLSGEATPTPAVHPFDAVMITIPEGEFRMGADGNDPYADDQEKPCHEVFLRAYQIDKYEVTNSHYCEFLNAKRATGDGEHIWIDIENDYCQIYKKRDLYKVKDGYENYPVLCVSWFGATAYACWMGKRLPTEAEWERAARGKEGFLYPWGNIWDDRKCINSVSEQGKPGQIDGGGDMSDYGVMNMAGNVSEWCSDWYMGNYYSAGRNENPPGPVFSPDGKVIRGGNWQQKDIQFFRTTFRMACSPEMKSPYIGFRLAKNCD